MSDTNDYEVGYRKPPKKSQWQKGQSGNRQGRSPRKTFDPNKCFGDALAEILIRKVSVTEDGKPASLRVDELMVRQLVDEAAKGNTKAIKNLSTFMELMKEEYFTDAWILILNKDEIRAAGKNSQEAHRKLQDEIRAWRERIKDTGPGLKRILYAELDKRVTATIDGKRKRITKYQLIAESMARKAMKGDPQATRLVVEMSRNARWAKPHIYC